MDAESLPSKAEVMSWSSTNLASYLKAIKMSGCDHVVMKNNLTGVTFLNMTDKELKKFPTAQIPFIIKICKDINQNRANKAKKNLFQRANMALQRADPQRYHIPEPAGGDSDEFEDSDDDYEEPDMDDSSNAYIRPHEHDFSYDYEPPPAEKISRIKSHLQVSRALPESDYLDNVPRGDQESRPKRLNISEVPSRPEPTPVRLSSSSSQSSTGRAVPTVDRRTKPVSGLLKKDSGESKIFQTFRANLGVVSRVPSIPPKAATQSFNSQQNQDFPPPPNFLMDQYLDPKWYVGQMTRVNAEVLLRQVNRDGGFLVRDGSKGCTEQPYTLMVLHQDKVYNIQIRFHGRVEGYSLGTGLKGLEVFPGVLDIVEHHKQIPLILIDGLDRDAGFPRQCCLTHPAGN